MSGFNTAKQGADLHSNTYAQALASEYICSGAIYRQAPKIIELYRPRQEAMLAAMEAHFPGSYSWTKPDGGMFIWVEGRRASMPKRFTGRRSRKKSPLCPGNTSTSIQRRACRPCV